MVFKFIENIISEIKRGRETRQVLSGNLLTQTADDREKLVVQDMQAKTKIKLEKNAQIEGENAKKIEARRQMAELQLNKSHEEVEIIQVQPPFFGNLARGTGASLQRAQDMGADPNVIKKVVNSRIKNSNK